MKNLFKSLTSYSRGVGMAAAAGFGIAMSIDKIGKVAQDTPKNRKNFLLLWGGLAGIALSSFAAYRWIKDRSESKRVKDSALGEAEAEVLKKFGFQNISPYSNVHGEEYEEISETGGDFTDGPTKAETMDDAINRAKVEGVSNKRVSGSIRPGELAVFAGGPGDFKSIAAGNIGHDAALGKECSMFPKEETNYDIEYVPQNILLYDAEQEDDDILERYGQDGFEMPSKFKRLAFQDFNSSDELLKDLEVRTSEFLRKGEKDTTILIDNITSYFSTLSAEQMRKFYQRLKKIQKEIQIAGGKLTIIIFTHLTKIEEYEPVERTHVNGTSNILNFATQCIALRPTNRGSDVRMMKYLKVRKSTKRETVSLVKLVKEPYFHLEYIGEAQESEVLPVKPKAKKNTGNEYLGEPIKLRQDNNTGKSLPEAEVKRIWELYAEGNTQTDISQIMGISRKTVGKYLKGHNPNCTEEFDADVIP